MSQIAIPISILSNDDGIRFYDQIVIVMLLNGISINTKDSEYIYFKSISGISYDLSQNNIAFSESITRISFSTMTFLCDALNVKYLRDWLICKTKMIRMGMKIRISIVPTKSELIVICTLISGDDTLYTALYTDDAMAIDFYESDLPLRIIDHTETSLESMV